MEGTRQTTKGILVFEQGEEEIVKGDFVTINDESVNVEIYVVGGIEGDVAQLYGLALTSSKDDIYIHDMLVPLSSLIKLDDSFVNVDGVLWQIRKKIVNDTTIDKVYSNIKFEEVV